VALCGALLLAAPAPAQQQATLEGSWSGSGTVELPSGATERARCRATFRRQSQDAFTMSAVCATASTRVVQTGTLERYSATRFGGNFYNAEYGVSGSVVISVRGNTLIATLEGGGGSGRFQLSR
jgi:hypothetical protein